jgi:hypothetical protein
MEMISCTHTYDAPTPSSVASYYIVCWTLNVQLNTITVSHLCNRNMEGFYLYGGAKDKNHIHTYLGKVTAQAVFCCLIRKSPSVCIQSCTHCTIQKVSQNITLYESLQVTLVLLYSAFPGWGNGLLKGRRVRRFSATTEPFAASESAVACWVPHVNFPCLHTFIRIL